MDHYCPMHSDVRGMKLVPEGTRFAFLRHMMNSPLHVAIMVAVMVAAMAAAMMLVH